MTLSAPFPWFGSKSRIAADIWARLGNVTNYVEPFFGSGAVLLSRPHVGHIETVNDKDRFLSNFWRAVQHDPEAVTWHLDQPVNESDLTAVHLWLLNEGAAIISRCDGDPDFFDAKVAGRWVWGLCSWIGGGWCSGDGPWTWNAEIGEWVARKLPHLGNAGKGVNRQLPHLGDAGKGVNRQLPHLGDAEPSPPPAGMDQRARGEASKGARHVRRLGTGMRAIRDTRSWIDRSFPRPSLLRCGGATQWHLCH